mmetsp:Transcript_52276/g.131245  ORF Transcript_52276/g.131245 Transcript_52276/m.131245 type:complete len:191 (-) Transcript_52276:47-619(-)
MVRIINGEIVQDDDPRAVQLLEQQRQSSGNNANAAPTSNFMTQQGASSATQQIWPGGRGPSSSSPSSSSSSAHTAPGGGVGQNDVMQWLQDQTNLFNQVVVVNWQVVVAAGLAAMGFGLMGLVAVVLIFFAGKSYTQRSLVEGSPVAAPAQHASFASAPASSASSASSAQQSRQPRPWGSGPVTLDSLRD